MISNGPGRALGRDQPRERRFPTEVGGLLGSRQQTSHNGGRKCSVKPWRTVFLDVADRLATDLPEPGIYLLRKIVRVLPGPSQTRGAQCQSTTIEQNARVASGRGETLESCGWCDEQYVEGRANTLIILALSSEGQHNVARSEQVKIL